MSRVQESMEVSEIKASRLDLTYIYIYVGNIADLKHCLYFYSSLYKTESSTSSMCQDVNFALPALFAIYRISK